MARRSSLPDGAVVAGQSPATVALPEQAVHGSQDLWPLVRDPSIWDGVTAGDYDAILVELDEMGRAHAPALAAVTGARLAALGHSS